MGQDYWFRPFWRYTPWSVYPIHWKGWILQILGPVFLVLFGNFAPVPSEITFAVIVIGVPALMIAVYTHTDYS